MPRGYLKRHSSSAGRKQSRGGHGRNNVHHKVYGWLKDPCRQRDSRLAKWDLDTYLNDKDVSPYSETDDDYYNDDEYSHWEDPSATERVNAPNAYYRQETRAVSEFAEAIAANTTRWISAKQADEKSDTTFTDINKHITDETCLVLDNIENCTSSFLGGSSLESYSSGGWIINNIDNDSQSLRTFSCRAPSTRPEDCPDEVPCAVNKCYQSPVISSAQGGLAMTNFESAVLIGSSYVDDDTTATTTSPDYCAAITSGPKYIVQKHSEQACCAICLENKPSIKRFMSRCNHPAACLQCLQSFYLDHQIKDPSNFPLKCFWPWCRRVIRDTQVRQIVSSESQMIAYYLQASRARAIRLEETRQASRTRVVRREERENAQRQIKLTKLRVRNLRWKENCCDCGETQIVYPGRCQSRQFRCHCCRRLQPQTLSIHDVQSIVAATGDYLVNCPSCTTLIHKDGGCDHMTCGLCDADFSFATAQDMLATKSW